MGGFTPIGAFSFTPEFPIKMIEVPLTPRLDVHGEPMDDDPITPPDPSLICLYDHFRGATPPVGTACFYSNEALNLSGWGVVTEAAEEDVEFVSEGHMVPWLGTLDGPVNAGQVTLDQLAPGCGVLPGHEYRLLPISLMFMKKDTA